MIYEITILGVVQGVGYRPFVAALAEQLHIKGSVCNSGGVVRIDAFGDAEAMDNFICRLRSYAPPAARVDRVQAERAEKEEPCPSDFRIVESEAENHADLPLLPPDLPVCEECLAEMKKPGEYQRPVQKEWQKECEANGNKYIVVRSLDEFIKVVDNYLKDI